jgi:curved DNA-binding protein CbpA
LALKDYYNILEISPSASGEEIKKAFRRMAQLYHPDKSGGEPYAHARFVEIKEAYDVLSNPLKKEHYLQQRWYAQSIGRKINSALITPPSVLKKLIEVNRYVARLDMHRMDHGGLLQHLLAILSDEVVVKINSFQEYDTNREIINMALSTGASLPFKEAKSLASQLERIETKDEKVARAIYEYINHHRRDAYWQRYRAWIVLLAALFLAGIIYFASRS